MEGERTEESKPLLVWAGTHPDELWPMKLINYLRNTRDVDVGIVNTTVPRVHAREP